MPDYPGWFDPEVYASQKVEQMNEIRYKGRDDWTNEAYKAELENFRDANGFPIPGATVEDKAYQNFLACNGENYTTDVPWTAINVSGSPYFDVGVYLQNLVDNAEKLYITGAPSTGWTVSSMLQHIYGDLHMSAWEHYTTVGMFANIDPSNDFSTSAYLEQRVKAMNEFKNGDGSVGWSGRDDWTVQEALDILVRNGQNPIMDLGGAGSEVFGLSATSPADATEIPADWSPWLADAAVNPYDNAAATQALSAAKGHYTSANGVNTRFEAVWNNATEDSTIAETDTINGGFGAYNTLAMQLDAPWAGFRGQNGPNVTNVGRVELTHGEQNVSTPYLFDARNIRDLERVDVNDNGPGAISLKNLGSTVKQVFLNKLDPGTAVATQVTDIEFAAGAVTGNNDSLELGVASVGSQAAPAPIRMSGIENLTVTAASGDSFVNLLGVSGMRNLNVDGGGNIVISNVPNGVRSYDASAASGVVNMAASDLQASDPVRGGIGVDTLTLTRNFTGSPVSWSGIEQLAINPGVSASIGGANIHGLSSLWVNSNQDVSLGNLPATRLFNIYETFNGSRGHITVNGAIQDVHVSNSGYASGEGARSAPTVSSDAAANISIASVGKGDLGGTFTFSKASGSVSLAVTQDAAFSGNIIAPNTGSFEAEVQGELAGGLKFNVVDRPSKNGTVSIYAANGIGDGKAITLDSDGASNVTISAEGNFALSKDSSLKGARELTISLDGNDAAFTASQTELPQLAVLSAKGGDLHLGQVGGTRAGAMEIRVDDADSFSATKIQTGSHGNIVANIKADSIAISSIETGGAGTGRGDVHLTFEGETARSASMPMQISGADIYLDVSMLTGTGESGTCNVAMSAAESINFLGAGGADNVTVNKVGARGPSNFDFGDGADTLRVSGQALTAAQRVDMQVDFGADTVADTLILQSQSASGAKLGVYVDNFVEDTDVIQGFRASNLTARQAQSLLSSFGLDGINVSNNMIADFGSGDGVLYNGDLYGFNANASCMVVLAGVKGGVDNLSGAPEPPATDEPAA